MKNSLDLSHFKEDKLKHSFKVILNPPCTCGNDAGSTEHFFFHCLQFANQRTNLLSTIGNFNYNLLETASTLLTQKLFFGNMLTNLNNNYRILNVKIRFI